MADTTEQDESQFIMIDGHKWRVLETTLDSAVHNNYVDRTQTVAFRLVCSREIDRG